MAKPKILAISVLMAGSLTAIAAIAATALTPSELETPIEVVSQLLESPSSPYSYETEAVFSKQLGEILKSKSSGVIRIKVPDSQKVTVGQPLATFFDETELKNANYAVEQLTSAEKRLSKLKVQLDQLLENEDVNSDAVKDVRFSVKEAEEKIKLLQTSVYVRATKLKSKTVSATREGIVTWNIEDGDEVKANQPLGNIKAKAGNYLAELIVPTSLTESIKAYNQIATKEGYKSLVELESADEVSNNEVKLTFRLMSKIEPPVLEEDVPVSLEYLSGYEMPANAIQTIEGAKFAYSVSSTLRAKRIPVQVTPTKKGSYKVFGLPRNEFIILSDTKNLKENQKIKQK